MGEITAFLWSHMCAMRHDREVQLRAAPLAFARVSRSYQRQMRRRRNRYRFIAAMIIVGVGIAVAAILRPDWFSSLVK